MGGIVSHVIPAWNESNITRGLLSSLFNHTPGRHLQDIILVDNGSIDDTHSIINEFPIFYIQNKINKGFPYAVNQGIRMAIGDFICVWNNDMEVSPGWLEPIIEGFEEDYHMLSADFYEPPTLSLEQFRTSIVSIRNKGILPFAKGAPWIFKREVFDRIGYFDEQFFPTQCEDTDFLLRMSLAKMRHGLVTGVFLFHHGSVTQKSQLEPLYGGYSYAADNRKKFEDKWGTMHIDMKKAYETGDWKA